MSTVAAPLPAPPPKSTNARIVPVTIGGLLALFGVLVALGSGIVLAIAGSDSTIDSGDHTITTATSALVSPTARIEDIGHAPGGLAHPSVKVSASSQPGGPPVFVGIGPKAAVDRYLAGSSVDYVKDLEVDPFQLKRDLHTGSATPKPPAGQSFWVASSSARENASIDWKIRDGNYRLVVMNADGSKRVATDARFELEVPNLSTIALVSLLVGLGVAGGGIFLLVRNISGPSAYTGAGATPAEER